MSMDRIERTIDLKATVERVWRALTDYKEFSQWFGVSLEMPFKIGETVQGPAEYCGADKGGPKTITWKATVKTMDAPKLFAFTWHPFALDTTKDYSHEPQTLIEFRLEQIPSGTRLTVVESGFDKLPAHRREEAFPKHEGGWTQQMTNIQTHVER